MQKLPLSNTFRSHYYSSDILLKIMNLTDDLFLFLKLHRLFWNREVSGIFSSSSFNGKANSLIYHQSSVRADGNWDFIERDYKTLEDKIVDYNILKNSFDFSFLESDVFFAYKGYLKNSTSVMFLDNFANFPSSGTSFVLAVEGQFQYLDSPTFDLFYKTSFAEFYNVESLTAEKIFVYNTAQDKFLMKDESDYHAVVLDGEYTTNISNLKQYQENFLIFNAVDEDASVDVSASENNSMFYFTRAGTNNIVFNANSPATIESTTEYLSSAIVGCYIYSTSDNNYRLVFEEF